MNIKHSETYDEFHPKLDEGSNQPIIYAMDTEEEKEYLVVGDYYKIKVIKKHGIVEDDVMDVTSVDVESEREPYRKISIAGGTELIEYHEEFRKKTSHEEVQKDLRDKSPRPKKEKSLRSTNPKSKVIDRELAKYSYDEIPDYKKIVEVVISSGAGTEDESKKILIEVKGRFYMYKKGKKINPFIEEKSTTPNTNEKTSS